MFFATTPKGMSFAGLDQPRGVVGVGGNTQGLQDVTGTGHLASLHLGAVAFIHRFGSSLNTHVHFHVCVVDGVFEALPDAELGNTQSVSFHPAEIDDAAIAQVQANVRKRLLRAFVARGHPSPWIG